MGFLAMFAVLGALFGGYYALWQNELISQGYGLAEIASIVSIQTLIGIIFNIPTGIMADKIGHRRTSQIGFGFYALAFLLPIAVTSAKMITWAVILVGVGAAVLNGALEAWATAAREHHDQGVRSVRFMERDQAQRFGMILGALLIPAAVGLLGHGFGSPWSLFFVLAAFLVLVSLLIKDGMVKSQEKIGAAPSWLMSREDFRAFVKSRRQLLLFCGVFVFGMADGVTSTVFWPTIRDLGISSVTAFGVIQMLLSLSRLAGLEFWKRTRWTDHDFLPGVILLVSGVLFVAFAFTRSAAGGLPLWFLRIAILSAYFSTMPALILRTPGVHAARATVLSVVAVITSLGTILSATLISALGSGVSLQLITTAGGLLTMVAGGLMWWGVGSRRAGNG